LPVGSFDSLVTLASRAARAITESASGLTAPPGQRWYSRLQLRRDYDLWLIVWGSEAGVALHDHGGSAGALSVVSGILTEQRAGEDSGPGDLLLAGESRGFGSGTQHAVKNSGIQSAVSVHAYAPALTTMNFFDDPARSPRVERVARPEARW
jgi:hypothetical protein